MLHSEDTTYFSGGITPEQSQQRRRQAGALPGFNDNRSTQVALEGTSEGPMGTSMAIRAGWRWRQSDIVTRFGHFATIEPSRSLQVTASQAHENDVIRHTLVGGVDLVDEKASTGTRGEPFSESNKEGYGLFIQESVRFFRRDPLRLLRQHFIAGPARNGV
jgi:hypothetical protein